jgi:hypothetical protein
MWIGCLPPEKGWVPGTHGGLILASPSPISLYAR